MEPLQEAFQHHTWATEQLIRHLRDLPESALTASGPGTYGEVLATLSHLLAADGRYLAMLEQTPLPPRVPGPDATRSLDELADQLRGQAVRWRVILARIGETDVPVPARGDRAEIPHATNLLVAQALHHGNDHRTQICTVLSSNGYPSPDIDVWSYWRARRS